MQNLYIYIPLFVILLTFPTIDQWVNLPIGNTTIWWLTNFLTLCAFWMYKDVFLGKGALFPRPIKMFLIWVIVSGIYGFFMADYYWDYKLLINNLMIYLMGISFFYFIIPENISKISGAWCRFAIVGFWVMLPFMQLEAPGKFLFPFAFFVIFWPFYSRKWKIIVILFSIAVFVFGSLGARSTAIRFAFAFCLSFGFLYLDTISIGVIKIATRLFLIIPLILTALGLTDIFNVWDMNSYLGSQEVYVVDPYSSSKNDAANENLKADTRSFIYEENIVSAIKHNYVIQGRSLSRGYDSPFFAWMTDLQLDGSKYHEGERASSEVSILNVFTYMGLIGVLLYGGIFLFAVRTVFRFAHSKCMHLVALYVAFRWAFAWMEDFTRFDLNNLYLWVILAMCYSPYFLSMTDDDFKLWANNLLES